MTTDCRNISSTRPSDDQEEFLVYILLCVNSGTPEPAVRAFSGVYFSGIYGAIPGFCKFSPPNSDTA